MPQYLAMMSWWVFISASFLFVQSDSQDKFEIIKSKMEAITGENCHSKSESELTLDEGAMSQVPMYNKLLQDASHPNRTGLRLLHNMALNRAIFYSFASQILNSYLEFEKQPGLIYILTSVSSDVTSLLGQTKGSAIVYDKNSFYPNYIHNVPFNKTYPLYGPCAWWRNMPPSGRSVNVVDLGTVDYSDYTQYKYKMTSWPSQWKFPHIDRTDRRKSLYQVKVRFSNGTGAFLAEEEFKFIGPPIPSDFPDDLPVRFSRPYFDCNKSNKWIATASSPVVDYMPRYSPYRYLRMYKYVGLATQSIAFEMIDINPCPLSLGNPGPNDFGGLARCKPTTVCEPLSGYGLRRDGYQCVCKAGYRYPPEQNGPFLGPDIEAASEEKYNSSFDCINATKEMGNDSVTEEKRHERSLGEGLYSVLKERLSHTSFGSRNEMKNVRKRRNSEGSSYSQAEEIMKKKAKIGAANCEDFDAASDNVLLPEDAAAGVKTQFESQGRMALRLSHLLSGVLQNLQITDGLIRPERFPDEMLIFGEVIASTISDTNIAGTSVLFDRNKFIVEPPNNSQGLTKKVKEQFGPYAYRPYSSTDNLEVKAVDTAGFSDSYLNNAFFTSQKRRWNELNQLQKLQTFESYAMIRSDYNGSSLSELPVYPFRFGAPRYEDGVWLQPRFKCDDMVNNWVVTYVVPFFGTAEAVDAIEFKGVVTVDVYLDNLEIDQCPSEDNEANIFKDSAKCNKSSSYCVPVSGRGYSLGGYRCECRQGFFLPAREDDWIHYLDGQLLEEGYILSNEKKPNRLAELQCTSYALDTTSDDVTTSATSLIVNRMMIGFSVILLLCLKR